MKKLSLIFSLLFSTIISNAQFASMDETRREYDQRTDLINQFTDRRKAQKIKLSQAFISDAKRPQPVLSYEYTFNTEGKITGRKYYNRKGEVVVSNEINYDANGNSTSSTGIRKGKPTGKEMWEYDTNGNNTVHAYYGKDDVSSFKYVFSYDAQNNTSGYSRFDKNGKLSYRYEYDYFDDGSRKETRRFDKKNKLAEIYTYDCGDVGKTEKEISKDTSKYCIRYEADADGNKIKIVETIMKKHHGWITKTTMDAKGNIIRFESHKPNGKIEMKSESQYSNSNLLIAYKRYKKGGSEVAYNSVFEYDDEGKNSKTITNPSTKHEMVYTFKYEKY